jgi:hypothetical protein
MLKIFKILFSLFIIGFFCNVQAQNLDSLSVIDFKYDSLLRSDGDAMSTLFYKHQNDVLINNLGPYGSSFYYPTSFFLFKYKLLESPNVFNSKLYKLSGFRPYTNITFINASRKEQQFSIKHVQEFGKLLQLDFNFMKSSSSGVYINQAANNTVFDVNLSYTSKKDNYEIKFLNQISRNAHQLNGGLFNVNDYENELSDDALNYSVNLNNSNAFLKKYTYQLEQRLDLFHLESDSIQVNKIYLKHKISYSNQQKVFFDNDPLSNIYSDLNLDSISTIDSVYNNSISNTGFIGFRTNDFSIELFGQYDQKEYIQSFGISSVYHNSYLGFLGSLKNKSLLIDVIGKYGVNGFRKDDFESELIFNYNKGKFIIDGGVSYFLNQADLKFVSYVSNHFIWNNPDFDKQSVFGVNFNFTLKKQQLEFNAESKILNNTLYYDSLAFAAQDDESQYISTFSLAKNYKLLNFYFRTAFIYQITSDMHLFPLPDMIGRQVLYYQKYIFKGALKFQFGVGVSYTTGYYGYAYMPATNEFYVQENTVLGYYPKVDVFINTHLKRAQIFLKYEHVNAGNSLQKSYVAPGYPPMSKSLKFGVSWNLFD